MLQRMKDPIQMQRKGNILMVIIEKKLVRSYDVQFIKEKTTKYIDKLEKTTLKRDNNLDNAQTYA